MPATGSRKQLGYFANHPIARACGIVTSLDGGPFFDQYLEVKWSGTILTYRYDNIHQLDLA